MQGEVIDASCIVAVSIIRAGDALLDCFIKIAPEAAVGKILIQRNEETKLPVLYYSKLPMLEGRNVVLLDPMLGTGGSAKAAIQVLLEKGAEEARITFICVVSCPEGLQAVLAAYPQIQIVTGEIDEGLNEDAYIVPGIGDYGDRFYGTT
jgi:uracil phosphoribosyltransferase